MNKKTPLKLKKQLTPFIGIVHDILKIYPVPNPSQIYSCSVF